MNYTLFFNHHNNKYLLFNDTNKTYKIVTEINNHILNNATPIKFIDTIERVKNYLQV